MLDYFKCTLVNIGLSEAWIYWESNYMTCMKNKFIKSESNWIEKLSQIQSKTVSWIKSEMMSQIRSETASQIKSEPLSLIKSELVTIV